MCSNSGRGQARTGLTGSERSAEQVLENIVPNDIRNIAMSIRTNRETRVFRSLLKESLDRLRSEGQNVSKLEAAYRTLSTVSSDMSRSQLNSVITSVRNMLS